MSFISKRLAIRAFALLTFSFFATNAIAQVSRPSDPRMDDINKLKDFNRVLDGEEKDKAAARTKEQRMAVVNEAFKRLQILHNEMMASIGSTDVAAKASATAEEIKQRATELNANLSLPLLENSKDKSAKATPADGARPQPTVDDYYTALCQLIRDFVKHVNLSPTDPKSGVEARRDLVALIKRSDELILLVGPSSKT